MGEPGYISIRLKKKDYEEGAELKNRFGFTTCPDEEWLCVYVHFGAPMYSGYLISRFGIRPDYEEVLQYILEGDRTSFEESYYEWRQDPWEKVEPTGSDDDYCEAFHFADYRYIFDYEVGMWEFVEHLDTVPLYSITNIKIPDNCTIIEDYQYADCDGITKIKIPSTVTSIGEGAFAYCSGLTSIVVPNSVKSIGTEAFRSTGITNIVISSSIESIGDEVFANCPFLTEVHILAKDPDAIDVTFEEEEVEEVILYVPAGTEDAYRHHPEFAKFKEVKTDTKKANGA